MAPQCRLRMIVLTARHTIQCSAAHMSWEPASISKPRRRWTDSVPALFQQSLRGYLSPPICLSFEHHMCTSSAVIGSGGGLGVPFARP